MEIRIDGENVILNLPGFSLSDTLNCGQCFRFEYNINNTIFGVVGNRKILLEQKGNDVIFYNTTKDDFHNFWYDYFDLSTDYEKIKKVISADSVMKQAIKFAGGIRVLKQPQWETLCSFIISQNNNIPRIKGIIQRLCENFGELLSENKKPHVLSKNFGKLLSENEKPHIYGFPSYKRIAKCSLQDLSVLKAGFRAKYIFDAAQKVNSGEISFEKVENMNIEDARKYLMKIKGVGVKVAECTLLFGFAKKEAFPIDVWIKRALDNYYKNGFPDFLKSNAGIAQQILFHYIRNNASEL